MKGSNWECAEKYVFSLQFKQRKGVGNGGHLVTHSTYTNTGYITKDETHLGKEKYLDRALVIFIVFCDGSPCLISLYTYLKYSVVGSYTDSSSSIHQVIRK